MSKTIPEVTSKTIFGHLKPYVKDPLSFLQSKQAGYGDIFTFRVANRQLIFINRPDYIQRVLQDNHRNYKKSEAYRRLALLLGDGLFTSDGAYWRSQRKTIQPAFHRNQIMTYAEVMHDLATKMIEEWKTKDEIALTTQMTRVTLSIISKTMLDTDIDEQGQIVEKHLPPLLAFMVNRITSPLAAPLWIPTSSNRNFKKTTRILDKLILEIIQHKKKNLGIDLLSQLIMLKNEDTGEGMTDSQLRDEVMTLFLAGHETTAMAMTWIINFILRDEALKTKLVDHVKGIRHPWDAVESFYIQNVISEALRMFAPVWILSREAIGHDYLGEYEINPHDRIIFSPYMIHRHPEYWQDPDQFVPDRFGKAPKHKYAYFPFGGGPRVCIGQHFALMEITILLVSILKNFPNMQLKSNQEVGYDYSITLRPDREIMVKL